MHYLSVHCIQNNKKLNKTILPDNVKNKYII